MKNFSPKTILGILMLIGLLLILSPLIKHHEPSNLANLGVSIVSAQEVYPEFYCYCGCTAPMSDGSKKRMPLDTCTCGSAATMKTYIDGLVDAGLSKEEAIIKTAQKWGLENIAEEETRQTAENKILEQAGESRPIISFNEDEFDFGDVSMAGGVVEHSFVLTNEGLSDLTITEIYTSCMCTVAELKVGDIISPNFGMPGHGKAPGWDGVAARPDETAELKIFFDPNAHGPDAVGPFERIIVVGSDDPLNSEMKVRIRGVVVK